MISIVGIDHVVLRTANPDAMLHFYCQVLACKLERQLPAIGLIQLRAGSSLIDLVALESELGRLGGKAPDQNGRNMDHLCLLIEKVDEQALLSYLLDKGIAAQGFAQRYGAEGFGPSIYIVDPEGNTVELKLSK